MTAVIIGIFIFGIIILVHEGGHFFAAKHFGVGINEFSVGMGPKIFTRRGKDGTDYSLRLLPIGGYVSMKGEDDQSDAEDALCNKSVVQRIIIVAAGAVMNLLLGVIIMAVVVSSSDTLYSNKIESFLVLGEDNKPVESYMGFEKGDEIIKVNSKYVNVRADYVYTVMRLAGKKCDITVLRDGERVVIEDFVFPTMSEKGVELGNATFFYPAVLEKTIPVILKETFCQSYATVEMIWLSLYDLASGRYSADAISGPVGVISEIKESTRYGFSSVLMLAAMITMNIGLFNLLPIPALDGGRLFFMLIELIRRKPVNPKIEGYIHAAGIMILFGLMILITFKDIIKLAA